MSDEETRTVQITVESIIAETDASIRVRSGGRNYNCRKKTAGWKGLKTIGASFTAEAHRESFVSRDGDDITMTWIADLKPVATPAAGGQKGGFDSETSKRQTAAHVAGAIVAAGVDVTTFDLTIAAGNFKALADVVVDWLNERPLDAMLAAAKEKLGGEEEHDPDADIPFG